MEEKKEAVLDYGTHQYNKEYIKDGTYCPSCGKQEVWCENDGGDYYVGETYLCTDCKFKFHMPYAGEIDDDCEEYLGVIKQLKSK